MKIIFSFILFMVSFSVFGQKKDSIAFSKISAIEDSLNSKNFIRVQKEILNSLKFYALLSK
ncbi:hypothetical protein J3D55_001484 [Chryseobacterium ginsenosidimutans]|nr:hypothetical protein [Chryseobacterium ginsenosidimutans]